MNDENKTQKQLKDELKELRHRNAELEKSETNREHVNEAHEYTESIINTVREPLIVLDQDLGVVIASRSFYEFFKVKPEETMGQLIYDLGNKQWDIPKLRELLETILPQKATFDNHEVEHDFSTIGRRIMLLNARQIQRVLGKERIILLAIEDITERKKDEAELIKYREHLEELVKERTSDLESEIAERKQVEEVLQESEERLQAILDNTTSVIYLKDKEGRYILINSQFEDLFHVTKEKVLGKTDHDIFPGEIAEAFRANDLKVLEANIPFEMEEIAPHDDGPHTYISVKFPIYGRKGLIIGICGISTDITERKRAEEALRESEERFRTLFEQAADCIILMEIMPEGVPIIRDVNSATSRILGYDYSELVGKPVSILLANPDRQERVTDRRQKIISGQQVFEEKHRCKDGTIRDFEVSIKEIQIGSETFSLGILRDITERKRAEEALRESESKHKSLIDNFNDMIFTIDLTGKVTFASQSTKQILGYESAEIINMNILDFIPEEDRKRAIETIPKGMKGEKIKQYQTQVITKSGEKVLLEIGFSRIYKDGAVVGAQAIAKDITARKRAEEALRNSEERFRELFANMSSGVAVYEAVDDGKDFVIRDFNMTGEKISNISRDRVIGRIATEVFPGLEAFGLLGILRRVWKTGTSETQPASFYKDNRISGWRENRVFKLPSGEVVAMFDDISESKRAEAALRDSEEKHRILYESSRDAIMTLEPPDWRLTLGNPATVEMFRARNEAEFTSKGPWAFSPEYQPDGRLSADKAKEMIEKAVKDGSSFFDWTHKRLDGEEFPATVLLTRFEWKERTALQATVRDITEMKKLESNLHQAMKMEAIGRLAGGIAHDFNNILAVIIAYAGFIKEDLKEDDPMREDAQEIYDAGQRAATLTRQLLAFSRKEAIKPEIINLNNLVGNLDKMLRRIIGEDIELETIMAEDLGNVKADTGQMEQALANLAVNARDAMPDGGKLTIETKNVYLDEQYSQTHVFIAHGSYVMLAVSDTGCGMDAKTMSRIFEPFFTTKEVGKGTGMGLATVYGIVKQNNGYILAYSELGQGTTFKIYLPDTTESLKPIGNDLITSDTFRGNETILLVEDEEAVRQVASRILKNNGYKVLEASHGREALLICEKYRGPIHLLLTDVIMPQMSGKELADRLRKTFPEMKIVYMSGYTDNTIAHHGILEDDIVFVQKPFNERDLLEKVYKTLRTR